MLGNFFRRPTDHKQSVNTRQNVDVDSPTSRGQQRDDIIYNMLAIIGLRLGQHCQFLTLEGFVKINF
jgi:hypothetical protein